MRIALVVLALTLVVSLPSAQTPDSGRATFVNRCAGCHGTDGNGGELGPAQAVARSDARTNAWAAQRCNFMMGREKAASRAARKQMARTKRTLCHSHEIPKRGGRAADLERGRGGKTRVRTYLAAAPPDCRM